jgi:hypothetical protein
VPNALVLTPAVKLTGTERQPLEKQSEKIPERMLTMELDLFANTLVKALPELPLV